MYAALHRELRDSLLQEEKNLRNFGNKRNASEIPQKKKTRNSKQASRFLDTGTPGYDPRMPCKFPPLRAVEFEVKRTPTEETSNVENIDVQQQSPRKSGRPPTYCSPLQQT
jgi:hypothetical protein